MKIKKLLLYILTMILITLVFPFSSAYATDINASIHAPVALLMDSTTGKILYQKDAHKRMYPASTTKIMTAILALENCKLTDVAKVSYNAIFSVPVGYSNANLQLDEELTIEQLLFVLLIPSANDAANVLAEHIAGSVESFATMMNTKAKELGCEDTHFVNPNGVHNEDHYSSAYDLALMGQYAMKNEIYQKLAMETKYTLPVTNKYDKADRIFNTTNKLVNPKSDQYYEFATGIKTGYTVAAKNCIVASAKKEDLALIAVILCADNDASTKVNKFNDCISLFDYGFENYAMKKLAQKDEVYKVISPSNATKETKQLNVLYENTLSALVAKSDMNKEFSPEVELDKNIKAPISKGSVVGKLSYTIDDIKYTTNLIAGQDIVSNSTLEILIKIALLILALCLIRKAIVYSNQKNYKRKKGKGKRIKPKTSSRKYK